MRVAFFIPIIAAALFSASPMLAQTHPDHDHAAPQHWSFEGPLGNFDLAAVQRGYLVYEQVCSSCHGMKHVQFRDLEGMGLDAEAVKTIASGYQIQDGRDLSGVPKYRHGLPDDAFPTPVKPAGVPEGVVPPDQSRLTVVYPGGPDRIYALLTGYGPAPAGVTLPSGQFYNRFASGRMIAMKPPLRGGEVHYPDGTSATVEQEARDVTTFLAWVAQPHLVDRHRTGVRVLVYLLCLAILLFILKRRIWSNVE
ncbi:cytochrome c1 [Acetobacter aceti]|uniref:Cytochrome c1 n=1 Tax=Acetobacter aceti TaxID=435 RepID=A0A6S6PPG0_ACEAC|nr:cytochrome c1 [Acetobacter aceti]BCI68666.1 ribosomal protein P2 [Acetobacter aceti]